MNKNNILTEHFNCEGTVLYKNEEKFLNSLWENIDKFQKLNVQVRYIFEENESIDSKIEIDTMEGKIITDENNKVAIEILDKTWWVDLTQKESITKEKDVKFKISKVNGVIEYFRQNSNNKAFCDLRPVLDLLKDERVRR